MGTLRGVDEAKAALLFGAIPSWADPDDPDDRSALLAADLESDDDDLLGQGLRAALHEAVADQIANEDPPAVWATAQRLLAMGLDRRRVLQDLALTLSGQIYSAVGTDRTFAVDEYAAALDRLPLPTAAELEAVMVEIVKDS